MLGLVNFLANHGVTYAEFGDALEVVNRGPFPVLKNAATRLAQALRDAIFKASYEAKLACMDRCWTIAPTATCSYRYTDLKETLPPQRLLRQSPARLTVTVEPLVSNPISMAM